MNAPALGIFGINMGVTDPEVMGRVARAAEEAGYDSVWSDGARTR